MMLSPRNCVILHAKIAHKFGKWNLIPQNIEAFNNN